MIDWPNLRNPLLQFDGYSIKDSCMAFDGEELVVFFSAFDAERSHVTAVRTRDFRTFSDFEFWIDGPSHGYIGMCSPDVSHADGRWVLTFNSWGDDPDNPNQLFYRTSEDLKTWSDTRPLAHNLTGGVRHIDAAVASHADRWFLIAKSEQNKQPFLATALDLAGPWDLVGDGRLQLLAPAGVPNGMIHENFQFVHVAGRWRMVSTDYWPHHPWMYTLVGDADRPASWKTWECGYRMQIPREAWNTRDLDNASALLDHRDHDGWFYLLYAGNDEQRRDTFVGAASHHRWDRGWNRLALARSRDLVQWYLPGQMPDAPPKWTPKPKPSA